MSVLFINACVREDSRTLRLARKVLGYLGDTAEEVCLETDGVRPMTRETLKLRDRLGQQGDYTHPMLTNARKFAEADEIVVAAPFWDLSFPALLKAYFESVMVSGVTFKYNEGVPYGLCRAKRLIYVTTAGGPVFMDFGFPYVKALAEAFCKIPETVCFRAERLDIIGSDTEGILSAAEREIEAYFHGDK